MKPRKYPKLRGKTRSLASMYIAEELHTRQIPRKQAIAIGISRAKTKIAKDQDKHSLSALCTRYGIKPAYPVHTLHNSDK